MGIAPDILLTSPYVRAVQTGEIVCEALEIDPKTLQATDALKPEAEADQDCRGIGPFAF